MKPKIYHMKNQGSGNYRVIENDYKPIDYGVFFFGEDDWTFEKLVYAWTQSESIDGTKVPIPDGSLIRINDPNLTIYMMRAWPTIVGGNDADMSRFKQLHFMTDV